MFEKLTGLLDHYIDMGIPGYDCIVYHNGKCVYRHMNGYSDVEKKIPMNGKERYFIYSCTKPLTCVAALQLYEKGKFTLEEPLSKYLPEFETMYVKTDEGLRKAEKSIKIKDLFCMTAGFSYDLFSEQLRMARKETDGKCPTRKTIEYLAKEPLFFEAGERYEYSLCHDVLAALVEVISGEKFEDYVQKHIFDPLGMVHTTYHPSEEMFAAMAEQYVYDAAAGCVKNYGKKNDYVLGTEYASGGAGLVSTVEDYSKFLEGLRQDGVLLKPETVDLMSTNCMEGKQQETYHKAFGNNYGYGLGVRCPMDERRTDFGWGGAAGAYLAIDRVNRITVYYAQHVLCSPNDTSQIIEVIKEELKK